MIIELNTNLQYLFQTIDEPCSDFQIEKTQTGNYTFKYNGYYIHSTYNPEKEGEKIANIPNPDNTTIIFFIGLGFCYHIKAAINKMKGKKCTFIIFEKHLDLIKLCISLDLLDFITENVYIIYGNDYQNDFYKISQKLNLDDVRGYRIISLTPLVRQDKEYYDNILNLINSILSSMYVDKFTKYELERLWIKNIIENSNNFFKNILSPNYKTFKDKSAVIIMAGPSLKNSLQIINEIKNKAYIFCVDTALGTLIDAEIIPDYVVSVDSQLYNEIDFYKVNKDKHKLNIIAETSVYPGIKKFADNIYYFTSLGQSKIINFFEKQFDTKIPVIETEISVAFSALNLALMCNFGKIILFGLDLGYTDDITHSVGSPVYDKFLYNSNKYKTIQTSFFKIINKRNTKKTGKIKIDTMFQKLKESIENLIKQADIKIYNFSEGQTIEGTISGYKEEIYRFPDIPKKEAIFSCNKFDTAKLEHIFTELLNDLCSFKNKILDMENIEIDLLLKEKKIIEEKYPFLSDYFMQDDLYYNRKQDEFEKKTKLFALSLINRLKTMTKNTKRALINLKSTHD